MTNGAKFVKSPYWPDSDRITKGRLPKFVNPHFPFGVPTNYSTTLHKEEVVLVPTRPLKGVITLKSGKQLKLSNATHKKLLKRLKKECINKSNLTTVVRTSLDVRHAVGID